MYLTMTMLFVWLWYSNYKHLGIY